ncbi:hypothetical protein REPUB_Repub11eG0131200 [Reevesia pubescens]
MLLLKLKVQVVIHCQLGVEVHIRLHLLFHHLNLHLQIQIQDDLSQEVQILCVLDHLEELLPGPLFQQGHLHLRHGLLLLDLMVIVRVTIALMSRTHALCPPIMMRFTFETGLLHLVQERERQFEIDIRRAKGLEVKRMLEDGNCLFRAVADQVYGDSEAYDLIRQMCIDYMERERDHFSPFITEGFTSYCKRKRRDKVYGNNAEIQALSEMYNRPIHIYSYSVEPINIFHGNYNTDTPPIRLSYHHGNHYNSLVDPRRLTIGAGLGFSCLRGANVDKNQVKAAIKAQQDQQIDNALLAEGRFYSDLELTEKEIERMVMEASRAEYLANDKFKPQVGRKESSTSTAEPSSSGARPSGSETKLEGSKEHGLQDTVLSSGMQLLLSMGFSYLQAIEAYSIFGDDVDSMVCYLLETGSSSRRKGKATE